MAWTNPRTWVAAEIVTAAIANLHIRDNLVALTSPTWTTLTLASGYVANSLGYDPAYEQCGDAVELRGQILKSSGVISSGTTLLTLPSGQRPASQVDTVVATNVTSSGTQHDAGVTRLKITTGGLVTAEFASTTTATVVCLDGVRFFTT